MIKPILIFLATFLHASSTLSTTPILDCISYEQSFLLSTEAFIDNGKCSDADSALRSFRQMLFLKCELDRDYIKLAHMLHTKPCNSPTQLTKE